MANIACLDFDEEGWAYSGMENGSIYVWADACKVVKQLKVHSDKITVIAATGGKIFTGANGKVGIVTAAGGNFKLEKFVDLG